MGLFSWLIETLQDRKHNKNLEKMGVIDKNEIRLTTVGWKRDDSYIPDPGNRSDGKHKTPSGNEEYYKVTRRK